MSEGYEVEGIGDIRIYTVDEIVSGDEPIEDDYDERNRKHVWTEWK